MDVKEYWVILSKTNGKNLLKYLLAYFVRKAEENIHSVFIIKMGFNYKLVTNLV